MRAILAALAAAFCLAVPARAAVVALETDATGVSVGDVFDVRLTFEAEGAEFLLAFLVDVAWSGAVVEGVALTDALGPLDQTPDTGNAFVRDFGDFVQLFAVSQLSDAALAADQPGAFTIATLSLRATEAGMLTITLGALREFSGAAFGALGVTFAPEMLSLAVSSDVAPVPLPPAAALFAGGLALLARQRGVRISASVS